MDGISIPEDQITSFDNVARGVQGLRILFVNVFSVVHDDGSWTLIDAGLPFSEPYIRHWAEKNFKEPPNAILLTHGHFDHVGAARSLAEAWNVPICAHDAEVPFLSGQRAYAPPDPGAGGGLMSLLSPLYPHGPIDLGDRLRPFSIAKGRQTIAELPQWELIETPGHTEGHVSFFRPQDRTLIVGDAFCTTKPESFFEAALVQQPELHGPPSYFTWDWQLAATSVRKLATLDPQTVAPGHGKAIAGANVRESLRTLAQDFDALSVPVNR